MTTTDTRAHVTRRTLVLAVAAAFVVALVVGLFAGRAWADAQRYDRCVQNAGNQWTAASVDALCRMVPGTELVPAG